MEVAYSRDGKSFLTKAGTTIRVWDAAMTKPVGQPIVEPYTVCAGFSPDMKIVLTTGADNRSRLWHAVTGRPIGPPLLHPSKGPTGRYGAAAYSPDGKTIATQGNDMTVEWRSGGNSTARLWHLPSTLDDDFTRMESWVQTITGLVVDDEGNVHAVQPTAWQERRERLRQLGGSPKFDSGWLFDPVLFGVDPTDRARAWAERKCWDNVEDALNEAVLARPLNGKAREERARYYLGRLEPERAAANYSEAISLDPENFSFRLGQFVTLLASGNRHALRQAGREVFHGQSSVPHLPDNCRAILCALAPEGIFDKEVPMSLAGLGLGGFPEYHINSLGAVLYRAGRFEQSIRCLENGIKLRNGDEPTDWPFMAMAHHRLGHREEALRWINRFRSYKPSTDPNKFWDELEVRLLRSEAEAVVLYDPTFPADPFSPAG
jgi:tetratricopeptide (TPR) repeat protein